MKKIDHKATHKRVVELLSKARKPWHYKQLCNDTVQFLCEEYSDKSDHREKFRQHYADHEHNDVCFIPGGHIGLWRWFPRKDQLNLFPPEPVIAIEGDCLVSYDAGYEQALRQQHMKDWFKDATTYDRYARRRQAALAESHVERWFAQNYPQFYRPPRNEGQYDQWCKEDFSLVLPKQTIAVDVKTWSYRNENGYDVGTARKPDDSVLYLWAEWKDDSTTIMCGVSGGRWLKVIGNGYASGLTHITSNCIWSIESLIVMLNMASSGMDYSDFYQKLEAKRTVELVPAKVTR